jgi:WD40 repeat protein
MAMMAVGFVTAVNVWRGAKGTPPVKLTDAKSKDVRKPRPPAPKPGPAAAPSESPRLVNPTRPEPSDSLRAADIAPYELLTAGQGDPAQAPAQLVEIIGDSRLQDWGGTVSTAFTPDGKRLLTGSSGGLALVWDVASGQLIRTIKTDVQSTDVNLVLSADGALLATVARGIGSFPQVWETATGRKRLVPRAEGMKAFADHYTSLAFSPADRLLAGAGHRLRQRKDFTLEWNGLVTVWDLGTGLAVWTILTDKQFQSRSMSFASSLISFDRDGKTLYSLAAEPSESGAPRKVSLRAWEARGGREVPAGLDLSGNWKHDMWYWRTNGPYSSYAQICRGLPWLLYGMQKPAGMVDPKKGPSPAEEEWFLYDLTTRSTRGHIKLPPTATSAAVLDLSPDGKTLCLWSYFPTPGGLIFVDIATGATRKPKENLQGGGSGAGGVYSPDGSKLAIHAGSTRIWDVKADKELLPRGHFAGGVDSVRFTPDGKQLAIGVGDGILLWDLPARAEARFFKGDRARSAFSSDGRALALASGEKVHVLEVATGREKSSLEISKAPGGTNNRRSLSNLAFSPDGEGIALAYDDGGIELRDVRAGTVRRSYQYAASDVSSVAMSPDGRWIAASVRASSSQTVPESLREQIKAKQKRGSSFTQRFSNSSTLSTNDVVIIWDAVKGAVVREIPWATGPVSFDPAGQVLATGPFDDGFRDIVPIWDVPTGDLRLLLEGHKPWGVSARFGPGGGTVATWGGDGTVRLWDSNTGSPNEVIRLCRGRGHIAQAAFSPTGGYLATANGNGTVYILRLKPQ